MQSMLKYNFLNYILIDCFSLQKIQLDSTISSSSTHVKLQLFELDRNDIFPLRKNIAGFQSRSTCVKIHVIKLDLSLDLLFSPSKNIT